MKAIELIELIQKECQPNDEIYIIDVYKKKYNYNPDISIRQMSETEQDETGGWRDINHELIAGKPFHIF